MVDKRDWGEIESAEGIRGELMDARVRFTVKEGKFPENFRDGETTRKLIRDRTERESMEGRGLLCTK
jgi:hypothetical protein